MKPLHAIGNANEYGVVPKEVGESMGEERRRFTAGSSNLIDLPVVGSNGRGVGQTGECGTGLEAVKATTSYTSPSNGLLAQPPIKERVVVLWVMYGLEPLVRRLVRWSERCSHGGRSVLPKRAVLLA